MRIRLPAAIGGGERGQSLVEFALTLPLLISLLLGLVELGNGMNSYMTVLAAARDAARLGAQGGATSSSMLALVDTETDRLPTSVPTASQNCGSGAGVCITQPVSIGTPATNAVRVKVCYDHPLIVAIPGVLSGPLLMCSTTTMRVASGS